MLDFYRIYIPLFGLMFISQKNNAEKEIILFCMAPGKKGALVKSMLQYPISPLFVAYQAILMLLSCY